MINQSSEVVGLGFSARKMSSMSDMALNRAVVLTGEHCLLIDFLVLSFSRCFMVTCDWFYLTRGRRTNTQPLAKNVFQVSDANVCDAFICKWTAYFKEMFI